MFADLPEKDLARLCELITEVHLAAGQQLFAEGSPGDRAFVIKEGQLEVVKQSGGREVLLTVRHPEEVIGEISLIEAAPRMASVRARTQAVLLAIGQEQFERLLNTSPSAARAMLSTVIARWRSTEANLRQSEKMAQLGTLSAGLAHELNNPAAAVQRGMEQLKLADQQIHEAQLQLTRLGLSAAQVEVLLELEGQIRESATQLDALDPLTRADREELLEGWLEANALGDLWELVPSLISLGYSPDDISALSRTFPPEALPPVLNWIAGTYNVSSLIGEVHEGAARISDIVKALKSYSYLDQAPVQNVDVHVGLDNTLILLRNKLKDGITIIRDYAAALPEIQAYGSELNQVWTNIIDNAADAMEGRGELTIRTRHESDWIVVEIEDNGPGIPEENRARIFDPFFTTKAPGKGTGLGLDISYNIIVNKHKGDLSVTSRPGKTCFTIKLPLQLEATDRNRPAIERLVSVSDDKLSEILQKVRSIAVVGISDKEHLPSNSVPRYLQAHGYQIIPIHPELSTVLGEKAYPDLLSVPDPVDEVLIFRRPESVPEIVSQAIQTGARVLWMQEGIVHEAAAATAAEGGMEVVMDTCMRTSHRRLIGEAPR